MSIGQGQTPNDPYGALMSGLGINGQIQSILNPLYGMQLAQPMAQYGLDQTLANQGYSNTVAGLDISRGAVNREQGYLPQEQGIANQLLGLSGQDLGIARQRLGLQGQSLDLTEKSEKEAAQQAWQGQLSSATARGAMNTSGNRQSLQNIQTGLGNQLAQLGLQRQGNTLSGQGLDISGQRLGLNQQQSDIGFALRQGGLNDQLARIGLGQSQAGQSLQNNLQQAGLTAQSGVTNIGLGQINSLIAGAQGIPGMAGQVGALAPPPNVAPRVGGRNNTPGGAGPVFQP